MSVRNEQIQPTVIVKIDEIDTPRQITETLLADASGETHLVEKPALRVVIETIRLILKVCNHDIKIAVVVEIAEVRTHPAIGASLLAECYTCEKRVLCHLNSRIAIISIEEIRGGIVSNKDIHIAIVIYIAADNPQPFSICAAYTGFRRYIRKSAITVVMIENICSTLQCLRRAIRPNALPSAFWVCLRIELNVVDDIEIQITIGIKVYKSTTAAKLVATNSSELGNICKSAVAVVAIEDIRSVVRHIDVGETVVVVITDAASQSIACIADRRFHCYIGEGVSIVAIEAVCG